MPGWRRRRFSGRFDLGTRAQVSGRQILDSSGNVLTLRGVNQGTWLEDYEPDAANILATGANHVRIVFVRWWGDSYETGIDMYDSSASNNYLNLSRFNTAMNKIRWAASQGLWINAVFDSDNGAGNRGLGGANSNFFESTGDGPAKLAEWKVMQRYVISQLMTIPRVMSIELLAEPLPVGSDATWAEPLRNFYLDLIANARLVDPRVPFVIGPRNSYGLNNLAEIYLAGRTDIIYTWDELTNKTSSEGTVAANFEEADAFGATNNVPIYCNQFGRNSNEDVGDVTGDALADTTENIGMTAMNGGLSLANARGIAYAWWQWHQNTNNPDAYAIYYKTVYPGSGPDNWTVKPDEYASFAYHMAQTGAALETAAIAAATASSARLFYVKSDFSNIWQTNDTSTPVTAVGQNVGRIEPVVGGGNFSQATIGLRPTLAASVNGYAMQFTAASNMWLGLDTTYFASGDDSIVIMAFRAATSAANRVLFQTGTSGTTVRNPYLAVIATDEVQVSWRGDSNEVTGTINSVTTGDDRSIVATASKIGSDKKVFVNGVQESTTATDAVSGMASITRTRIGATTGGTNGFGGPIALVCLSKTMTDEQRRAIERWAAWLVAAPFRGALPA